MDASGRVVTEEAFNEARRFLTEAVSPVASSSARSSSAFGDGLASTSGRVSPASDGLFGAVDEGALIAARQSPFVGLRTPPQHAASPSFRAYASSGWCTG